MPTFNPIEEYRDSIVFAAATIYRAESAGEDPDPDNSRVNIMPLNLGDLSVRALHDAEVAEARVNVAARTIARVARLYDVVETGNPISRTAARVELGLAHIIDRPYLKGASVPGGVIDIVRGKTRPN